jgi:hypothetical protein
MTKKEEVYTLFNWQMSFIYFVGLLKKNSSNGVRGQLGQCENRAEQC